MTRKPIIYFARRMPEKIPGARLVGIFDHSPFADACGIPAIAFEITGNSLARQMYLTLRRMMLRYTIILFAAAHPPRNSLSQLRAVTDMEFLYRRKIFTFEADINIKSYSERSIML